MEFERWIRYLVPGYVALAPLIFAIAFLPNEYQKLQIPLLAALVALGPGVGFLVHQLHMFLHEQFYLTKPKRPIIMYITEKCEMKKTHNNKATFEITAQEALRAWYYFFHDSKTICKDLLNHITRSWYFIHSFCSTGWAFLFGYFFLVLLTMIPFLLEPSTDAIFIKIWIFFIFVYVVGCLFFFLKSWSTLKYIEPFEVLIAHKHWEYIENILTDILELRNEKPIQQSEAASTETAQPVSLSDG